MCAINPLLVSTFPPDACGLAAFTRDTADAVNLAAGKPLTSVAAISKSTPPHYSDRRVRYVIDNRRPNAYRNAAIFANHDETDVVSIQHEFGLYTGNWGVDILDFALTCDKPVVTTFHTLMIEPLAEPRRIIRNLAAHSDRVVVMTEIGAHLLTDVYEIPNEKICVIPHGVPEVPLGSESELKVRLGLNGKQVICTFGLINSGKGLELMIRAMPRIVARFPDALYLIVGVTHPTVRLREGEAYRNSLIALAHELGMSEHIRFVNEFLSLDDLLVHLRACDVYVTPYLGPDQIASGTLAYAMAAGLPIVSTAYLYAKEVLAEGRGILVPFAQSEELSNAAVRLLADPSLRIEMGMLARAYAKPMCWASVGERYLELFVEVVDKRFARRPRSITRAAAVQRPDRPIGLPPVALRS